MTPITLVFKHKSETANKQRFEEVTENKPVVGSLYVAKEIVGEAKSLVVTIAPHESH